MTEHEKEYIPPIPEGLVENLTAYFDDYKPQQVSSIEAAGISTIQHLARTEVIEHIRQLYITQQEKR